MLPPSSVEPSTNLRPVQPGAGIPSTNQWPGRPAVMPSMPVQQAFDIWGPLQRRKYLIALFCIIGAALGYLHYSKTPKSYASFTRLMITTQAPPTIVNGDLKLESVSLPKHVNLISSELILDAAIKEGELGKYGFSVSHLKQMIRVIPDPKSDETLTISCKGSQPEVLPKVLNAIVAVYEKTLEADSKDFGEDQKALMVELRKELSEEKEQAENRSIELYAKLGTTAVSQNGFIVNPYDRKAEELADAHETIKTELRMLIDRFTLMKKALESDDEFQRKVVGIEAKKYLGLSRETFVERAETKFEQLVTPIVSESETLRMPGLLSRNDVERRAMEFKDQIVETKFSRDELTGKLGSGHQKVKSIDKRIEYYEQELAMLEDQLLQYDVELKRLQQEAETKRQAQLAPIREAAAQEDPSTEPELDLKTFRAEEERQWINMYQLAMERQRQQLSLDLDAIGKQLKSVSGKRNEVASHVVELNLLQKQISQKGEAVRIILDQLKELDILSRSFTMTKVKTLDSPARGGQTAPSLPKSLALGTMLAFLAGFGLAILIDQSELSFRSPHEISEKLNIPVVGRIPRINVRKIQPTKGVPSLVVAHSPGSTAAEAFRDIRTAMFFQSNVDDTKTILFTSPSPGDGKSTTVANMAISIAQAGKRVILVDADFRRPRVHQYFDEPMNPGLLDVLNGECGLREAIQRTVLQENLYLLTAGGRPKNPGELVTSEQFRNLIDSLRSKFDYVLIDSPPILPVSDPATIASFVDGVYLVTRIRKGVKVTAQRAKETMDRVGTRWMGIVINGLDENPHYSEYGYQYGSYSYYGGMYGRYYENNYKDYRDKIASK